MSYNRNAHSWRIRGLLEALHERSKPRRKRYRETVVHKNTRHVSPKTPRGGKGRDRGCKTFALGDCDEGMLRTRRRMHRCTLRYKNLVVENTITSRQLVVRPHQMRLGTCKTHKEYTIQYIAPSALAARKIYVFACIEIEVRPKAHKIDINSTNRMLDVLDLGSRRK